MGERSTPALAGSVDYALLEPVRLAAVVRGNDHLVGGRRRQSVVDRDERIGIADFATCIQPKVFEVPDRLLQAS